MSNFPAPEGGPSYTIVFASRPFPLTQPFSSPPDGTRARKEKFTRASPTAGSLPSPKLRYPSLAPPPAPSHLLPPFPRPHHRPNSRTSPIPPLVHIPTSPPAHLPRFHTFPHAHLPSPLPHLSLALLFAFTFPYFSLRSATHRRTIPHLLYFSKSSTSSPHSTPHS